MVSVARTPSSRGEDAIAVIIDTSDSVPARTLAEVWAELREAVDEIRPERVFVLQVDAALRDATEYTADDLLGEIALKGRGGLRKGFSSFPRAAYAPLSIRKKVLECVLQTQA